MCPDGRHNVVPKGPTFLATSLRRDSDDPTSFPSGSRTSASFKRATARKALEGTKKGQRVASSDGRKADLTSP